MRYTMTFFGRILFRGKKARQAMSRARHVSGVIQFTVPSYLDGVIEVIDVWGTLCDQTSPPSLVNVIRKDRRKKLTHSKRALNSRIAASLYADVRKVAKDMKTALEGHAHSETSNNHVGR
jgi:hypothetical protein